MQKIEKWRIEQLSLLLSEISSLLRSGDNLEWANVFLHFLDESKNIISREEFDLDLVKKLVKNIKNCFSEDHHLKDVVLWHKNSREKTRINQDFRLVRARLFYILKDLEQRTFESIN